MNNEENIINMIKQLGFSSHPRNALESVTLYMSTTKKLHYVLSCLHA